MDLIFRARNVELSDSARSYAERKLGRLPRYFSNISDATVEFSREDTRGATDRYVVQVTLNAAGTLLRSEERAADIFTAIDGVASTLKRRIDRHKTRLYNRRNRSETASQTPLETPATEQTEPYIVRVKRFLLHPMTPEEAAEQMDDLGHSFFFFLNAETKQYSVIYRRNDGNYGLIEAGSE